jgi:hypothetical protein
MRFALVRDGAVVNVIESDSAFANAEAARLGGSAIESAIASPGDAYDGTFTRPAPTVVVPQSVTRRQARQALLMAGKLADVQPAIDAITDPVQRGLLQIEWDDSLNFDRSRPALIALAAAIGIDSAQLDTLFITAGSLR